MYFIENLHKSLIVYFDNSDATYNFMTVEEIWFPAGEPGIIPLAEKKLKKKLTQMKKLCASPRIDWEAIDTNARPPAPLQFKTAPLVKELEAFAGCLKENADDFPKYYFIRKKGERENFIRHFGKIAGLPCEANCGFDYCVVGAEDKNAIDSRAKKKIDFDGESLQVKAIDVYKVWGEDLDKMIGVFSRHMDKSKSAYLFFG